MRRALTVLTVCAAAAGGGAVGCGSDDDGGGAAGAGGPGDGGASRAAGAQDAALKFARCVREHGVDMPDPQVSEDGGMVQIRPGGGGGGAGPRPDDAGFRRAQQVCEQHLRAGIREIPAEQREEMEDKMLALARCMRAEGIEFPDPQPGQGLRIDRRQADQPGFAEAQRTCHEKVGLQLPGGAQP